MKKLYLVLSLIVMLLPSFSQASMTGLWSSDIMNNVLFLESSEHQVIAIQLSQDMTTSNIYTGSKAELDLSLDNIANDNNIQATVNSENTLLNGTLTEGSSSQELTAELLLTYLGSSYDGIWQTNSGHYLVYFTGQANEQENSETLNLVVDIKLNEDIEIDADSIEINGDTIEVNGNTITISGDSIQVNGETIEVNGDSITVNGETIEINADNAEIDIYIGNIDGNLYSGTSINQTTKSIELSFTDTDELSGVYKTKTISRPITTEETPFTATRIFTTDGSNISQ